MLRILGCIAFEHDLRLVVAAGLLCAFASWTAVTLLSRARLNESRRYTWVAAAGAVFGAGIWATHFVAMLAYQTSFPVGYDLVWTSISIVIAMVVSTAGFALIFHPPWATMGGALVGLGISAMHYVGMTALEGPFDLAWDARYVAASVITGAAFGASAIFAGITFRNVWGRIAAAGFLTVGICMMHFTGMSAVTLMPDPTISFNGAVIAPDILAVAIAAVALLIVGLGLTSAQLDRHIAWRRTGEAARLRAHIAELEATQQRLEATSRELQIALDDASAAAEAKSAFLAAMGHELRTPLNAIIGFSDVILSSPLGPVGHPRYAEYIGDIRTSGVSLLSLINNILDFARLDAGKVDLKEEPTPVALLLDNVRQQIEADAARAGIEILIACPAGLPNVTVDRRRIEHALLNLASNAIKFNLVGGCVRVSAASRPQGLAIEVADNGIGIAQEDLSRALDRFGQVDDRLSRKYDGAGLGLPLAKQLIELHGGTLQVESHLGAGTTVTIVIPASRVLSRQSAAA